MFADLNEIEPDTDLNYHLCIIGAGAAGISLAREFRGKKISVALIESGGLEFEQATQNLNSGKNTGLAYFPLISTRLRYFGGTTNHWGGQSIPLDAVDFEERPWVPDGGWPITYDEFSRYLKSAEEICGVPCGPYRWEYWAGQAGKREIPLDARQFQDAVFRYSRPVRRFGETFREDIRKAENITCFLNANALHLVTQKTGETVTRVEVGSLAGRRAHIQARQFVVACGGIENSRLLLLSNSLHEHGLGNQHDQLGRYFMEHPNFDTGSIRFSDAQRSQLLTKPSLEVHGSPLRLDFKLRPEIQRREKLLNHSAFLLPKSEPSKHAPNEDVGTTMRLWQKVLNKYDRYYGTRNKAPITEKEFTLRVRLEHAPYADSRVELAEERDAFGLPRAQLNLELGQLEGRTIEYLQKALALELGSADLGRMQITFKRQPTDWQEKLGWQYHHCGGTRMHDSPRNGVVDRDCRVHGTKNLYVAGSSVFPTCGHANPTINLVALTLRLADKLKSESEI